MQIPKNYPMLKIKKEKGRGLFKTGLGSAANFEISCEVSDVNYVW
jgi:hypothetical protein